MGKKISGIKETSELIYSSSFQCLTSAIDSTGIYCAGYAEDDYFETTGGLSDAVIIKLSKVDGSVIWSRQLGSTSQADDDSTTDIIKSTNSSEQCNSIVIDDEYLYCGGQTSSSLFETNGGRSDAFVMKLNKTTGSIVWGKQLGVESTNSDDSTTDLIKNTEKDEECNAVAINDDYIFCGGITKGSLFETNSNLINNLYVFALNKIDGSFAWGKQIGDETQVSSALVIDVDAYNSLKATAVDETGIYITGGAHNLFEANGGDIDAYVSKLNLSNGDVLWGSQIGSDTTTANPLIFGSSGEDSCLSLSIYQDHVYCAGYESSGIFDSSGTAENWQYDAFLMRLNKTTGEITGGNQISQQTTESSDQIISSSGEQKFSSIIVDSSGIYTSGYTRWETDVFEECLWLK